MAETKTRASKTRASSRSGKPTKRKAAKASKNGVAHADSARKAVEETAKQAGHSVGDAGRSLGRAARKARTPLLAGSAAVAGVAGGLALGARGRHGGMLQRRPKVRLGPKVKIDSHDIARAAKEVGQFGADVGQLASELRKNREEAHGVRRRSPIEVVLEGLTQRRARS